MSEDITQDALKKWQEKATKYERRLKDVVGAYKALLKEKETLQKTLDTLTQETEVVTDANDVSDEAASPSGVDEQLQKQIKQLKSSISSLTKEKNDVVQRFQNDKRIVAEQHRKEIQQLKRNLGRLKEELEQTKTELDQTKAMNIQLQQSKSLQQDRDTAQMIQLAQRRAVEAETRFKELEEKLENANSAKDTGQLESQVRDLSELVGRYENMRQQDAKLIRELRSQIRNMHTKQADMEEQIEISRVTVDKLQQQQQELISQEMENSRLIQSTESQSTATVEPVEPVMENSPDVENELLLKHKSQIEELTTQLVQSSQRLKSLEPVAQECKHLQTENLKLRKVQEDLESEIKNLREKQQQARDRALSTISDRDREIQRLRATLKSASPPPLQQQRSMQLLSSTDEDFEGDDSQPALLPLESVDSSKFFHVSQIQNEHEKETKLLRHRVHDLEGQLYDALTRADLMQEQAQRLKQEIRRLDRNQSRTGVNLEYLKNIVLAFLLHSEKRNWLVKAIFTALEFSQDEQDQVLKKVDLGL